MKAHAYAAFVALELLVGQAFAVEAPAPSPSVKKTASSESTEQAKRTRALVALRAASVPDELKAAIAADISKLDNKTARERIVDRLRLELVARGVFGHGLQAETARKLRASAFTSAKDAASVPDLRDDEVLRRMAATRDLGSDPLNLRSKLSTEQSIAAASALFGNSLAQALQQISPLTPITQQPPNPRSNNQRPTTVATAARAPAYGVRIGPVATQTTPNTEGPLTDCDKPLPPLEDLACFKDGMRCETFSRSEFGEVVEVIAQDGISICSGTLMSQHWVLTAAHCFLPKQSAAQFNKARGFSEALDARVAGVDLGKSIVAAENSHLGVPNYFRQIEYVLINTQWDPAKHIASGPLVTIAPNRTEPSDWAWPGDLALIRLVDKDAITTAQPPILASADFTGLVTTAGYGVTTVGDGSPGALYVAWPDNPVSSAHGALELDQPQGKNLSTFCKGDSGGPAFEGRNRGCPASTGEIRPRVIIGVASYYYGDDPPAAKPEEVSKACEAAPVMRFINVSSPGYRNWICTATEKEASGCV